ncbi:hypothetical protein ASE01_16790 [Nocardioides sp. Root190]|uniref:hypothetical protein n=1 Tax=Nocardioides sp. Root190 TaxID=1736488 RepID=UPI0006F2871D|nr:hypothetical protein [Nocardioides sp. Root190]KRB75023.1 hypothetical protein ASE01_16790 [Nocardioides sp. Root190]
MDSPVADDTWGRLASISRLLDQAAARLWAGAKLDVAWQSLGLGVYLAGAQIGSRLPEGYRLPDVDQNDRDPQSALQLLTAAHELTRSLPAHRVDLVNTSQLVVDLCDLVREARDLGC